MGWFLAGVYDRVMKPMEEHGLRALRAELIRDLTGTVVEVGAGTGLNLPHYGSGVERLVLTEPDRSMRSILSRRVEEARLAGNLGPAVVEVYPDPIERLPFATGSVDAVVCTLVLCSVPRVDRSLEELRRILSPTGRLAFIEHVAAEDRPGRLLLQRVIEPLWRLGAGNCRTTRRTAEAIERAGFRFERIERASLRKALPWVRPSVRGVAVPV